MAPDDEGFLENWVEDQGVVPVEICPACGLIHRLTHDDLPASAFASEAPTQPVECDFEHPHPEHPCGRRL